MVKQSPRRSTPVPVGHMACAISPGIFQMLDQAATAAAAVVVAIRVRAHEAMIQSIIQLGLNLKLLRTSRGTAREAVSHYLASIRATTQRRRFLAALAAAGKTATTFD